MERRHTSVGGSRVDTDEGLIPEELPSWTKPRVSSVPNYLLSTGSGPIRGGLTERSRPTPQTVETRVGPSHDLTDRPLCGPQGPGEDRCDSHPEFEGIVYRRPYFTRAWSPPPFVSVLVLPSTVRPDVSPRVVEVKDTRSRDTDGAPSNVFGRTRPEPDGRTDGRTGPGSRSDGEGDR